MAIMAKDSTKVKCLLCGASFGFYTNSPDKLLEAFQYNGFLMFKEGCVCMDCVVSLSEQAIQELTPSLEGFDNKNYLLFPSSLGVDDWPY